MGRKITDQELEIVQETYRAPVDSKKFLFFKSNDIDLRDFSKLDELQNFSCIAYLCPLLVHPVAEVKSVALENIQRLFQKVEDYDLNWLDESIRRLNLNGLQPELFSKWSRLTSITNFLPVQTTASQKIVLFILCSHSNGYIREAALNELSRIDIDMCIKMALIRANDWVKNVRLEAWHILSSKLNNASDNQLVKLLVLVDQLKLRSRQDHSKLVDKVESRFASPSGATTLLKAVDNQHFKVARIAFKLYQEIHSDPAPLINIAKTKKDFVIRLWALELASVEFTGSKLKAYLFDVSKDKLTPLRKRALYKLVDLFPQEAKDPLTLCLESKNTGLREIARFYLKKNQCFDFKGFYRQALITAKESQLEGLILGLSECGDITDWDLIKKFEAHSRPKVRSAVITSTKNLNIDCDEGWLLSKIISGCPSEIKAAKNALLLDRSYSLNKINTLHQNHYLGASGKALRLLSTKACQWTGLNLTLEAINQCTGDLSKPLYTELSLWLSQYDKPYWYIKPPVEVLERIILNSDLALKQGVTSNALRRINHVTKWLIKQDL